MTYKLYRFSHHEYGLDRYREIIFPVDHTRMWCRAVVLINTADEFDPEVRPLTNWREIDYRNLYEDGYIKDLTEPEAFIEIL